MDYSTPRPRRRLSDILAGDADQIREQFDRTEAAADFAPLPAGSYVAHVYAVELFNARTGTPGAKVQFCVAEGEHVGRMIFHDAWLTPAALPQTKRDLGKLGIARLEQLENGAIAPDRIRCKLQIALRADDGGEKHNRVRRFEVIGIDEPERDAFAPAEAEGDASFDPASLEAEGTTPTDAVHPGKDGRRHEST